MRVYVSWALQTQVGLLQAQEAAAQLMASGYYPFVPHLNRLWGTTLPEKNWINYYKIWALQCEALLALPGCPPEDIGFAHENKVPVFKSVQEVTQNFKPRRYMQLVTDFGDAVERQLEDSYKREEWRDVPMVDLMRALTQVTESLHALCFQADKNKAKVILDRAVQISSMALVIADTAKTVK